MSSSHGLVVPDIAVRRRPRFLAERPSVRLWPALLLSFVSVSVGAAWVPLGALYALGTVLEARRSGRPWRAALAAVLVAAGLSFAHAGVLVTARLDPVELKVAVGAGDQAHAELNLSVAFGRAFAAL